MLKRQNVLGILGLIAICFTTIFVLYSKQDGKHNISNPYMSPSTFTPEKDLVKDNKIIMSEMGNQTQREELGRATWKFLHTMMARYPEKPTEAERQSLNNFMYLFSTLYPCGDCAKHFNKLITQYPPQTSSRFSASQWLCAMHNKVNERLRKPIFDCSSIESQYPCGCAEEK